jgi:SAM-dependent methyltransferase
MWATCFWILFENVIYCSATFIHMIAKQFHITFVLSADRKQCSKYTVVPCQLLKSFFWITDQVLAAEPSPVMLRHARSHPRIAWKQGYAENVPLPDACVEGVVSTLALSHFSDSPKALDEMARISDCGPVVIFTYDRNVGRETWLYKYFPFLWDVFDRFGPQTPEELSPCPSGV